MGLLRDRAARIVYWSGVILPVFLIVGMTLAEEAGAKVRLGLGWFVVAGVGVAAIGVGMERTTLKWSIALLALAITLVPVELLLLSGIYILRYRFEGIQ